MSAVACGRGLCSLSVLQHFCPAIAFKYAKRGPLYQPETVVRIELAAAYISCPDPPGVGGSEALVNRGGYFFISGSEHASYLVNK